MRGRIGWLVAFFRRAEPHEPTPSDWALAFDAAIAVGAAAGAIYEMARFSIVSRMPFPVLSPYTGLRGSLVGYGVYSVHASFAALVVAALTALPLVARRFYPITAWLVIAAAIVVIHALYVPEVSLGTAVYAAYSAITHSRYRNLAIAMVALVTVVLAAALGQQLPRFPGRFTAVFAVLTAAVAGLGIRELRQRLNDSTARLRRAAAEAAAATERALAAERARIARELHDVVTHNVSVMVVQAGAARKIMATSPADAENSLLAVESTGREAMTELRSLLGLLSPAGAGMAAGAVGAGGPRPGGESAAFSPQPGIGELDALIGRVSAAGLPVELHVSGEPRLLSPGADLAAFRVVQEGLTNVLRHAGRAATTVSVEWGDELVIMVSNDGSGSASGDGTTAADKTGSCLVGAKQGNSAPGRGLLGLRERLALYGGDLTAGPQPGGGWQVQAVMPAGTTP
ncbi:MAG TPA: histidine kinase [Streptosporangiaceae bacterium]|nr:histidine kinase [Streptosporangiaceae bacterium]